MKRILTRLLSSFAITAWSFAAERPNVIILLTDNGGTGGVRIHNSGMRGNKGDAYEGGHRVPCFIRWPAGGLGGGRDVGGLTAHLDLLPTLAELCGLTAHLPQGLDGHSLVPLLRGKAGTAPDRFLFVRHDSAIKDDPRHRPDPFHDAAALHQQWRLIGGRELYDIQDDPGQRHDVSAQHPAIVAKLRSAQEEFWPKVYPANYQRRRPVIIGSEEVILTPLDARPTTTDSIAQQAQVRQGRPSFGEWRIHLTQAAIVHLEARRWPRETGAALTASLPAHSGPFVKRPPGKAIPIHALRVRIGEIEHTVPATPDAVSITVKVPLPAGLHTLTARFLDAEGREITDAYFLHLSKAQP